MAIDTTIRVNNVREFESILPVVEKLIQRADMDLQRRQIFAQVCTTQNGLIETKYLCALPKDAAIETLDYLKSQLTDSRKKLVITYTEWLFF